TRPGAVAEAAAARTRRPLLDESGRLMIVAADHPARGALGVERDARAMANRADLLERLCIALARPGVDGVLGTPDVLEDLLLLGVLDGKVAIGSMNRGGLAGAAFELDDRFTAYRARDLDRLRFDGGKLLLRIDYDDPGSLNTLQAAATAVNELAAYGLTAMLEPFIVRRVDGKVRGDLSAEAISRSMAIASGVGGTSAYTWLKVPVPDDVDDLRPVMETTTLPTVLLGGDTAVDAGAMYERWRKALSLPNVYGLMAGRALLYPADGDVAAAVDAAVELL
ncbi:MAG: Cgl0159 family (beta/alpha)8-fold protein, partial [Streptosporangiales bacterium]